MVAIYQEVKRMGAVMDAAVANLQAASAKVLTEMATLKANAAAAAADAGAEQAAADKINEVTNQLNA